MSSKVTQGELQEAARDEGIDPDQPYDELRQAVDEAIGIKSCGKCGDEFVYGWSDRFCTDGCEVEYIHAYS